MMLTIIIIYMLAMLFIGYWCNKHYIKGMTDFLLAGRRLGVVLCSFTLAATHFGGGCVFTGGEYGFNAGISGIWYATSCGIGLLLLGFLTAYKFRSLSMYTVPDYLEQRYGKKSIRAISALISTIALTGLVGACTLAAKTAFTTLGVDGDIGFYVSAAIFIAYTATGGLWAASLTDFFQLTIAALGVTAGAILVLASTGGWSGLNGLLLQQGVEQTTYFSITGLGPQTIIWILLPTVMYTLIGQDFYQRLFAAKDAKTARNSAIIAGIILVIMSIPPVIMGMGAKALAGVEVGTESIPWVIQNLMHPVIGGIVLAAILAAIMSSADSLLTAATSHVVKDFWIELFHMDAIEDEKKLLRISRIATVIAGIVAIFIAMIAPSLITVIIWSYTLYTAAVFVPVLGGVLWKRATGAGALAALIGGILITVIGIGTGMKIFGFPVEIYGALVSLVIFIIVSLCTKQKVISEDASSHEVSA